MEKKVKILMVDDRPENLIYLRSILDCPEYELICAGSGEEALKWVLKEDFAVILLDVQMPGLNGYDTAKLIHSRDKSKGIPIIFVTAIHQANEQVLHGYSLGAFDFIFKPINSEALKYKIKGFVQLYNNREKLELMVQEKTKELLSVNEKLVKEIQRHRKTEKDLRESENRFKTFFVQHMLGVSLLDCRGRIIECNPAMQNIFGYSQEELKWRTYSDFLYPQGDNDIETTLQKLLMGESSNYQLEKKFINKEGKIIWGRLYLSLARDENGVLLYLIGMLKDITSSKRAQEKACQLVSIVESTDDGIFSASLCGYIKSWNQGAKGIFGYEPEEIIGKKIDILLSPDKNDDIENVCKSVAMGDGFKCFDTVATRKDGSTVDISLTISPIKNRQGIINGFSAIMRDVTEYKRLQSEINRLDRLSLVGQMSATIAHEIRNPMTTIRGFLQVLREKAEFYHYDNYFDLMIGELDRANSIITEYLSLARNKPREPIRRNLKELLNQLAPLITADALNSNKDVIYDLQDVPDLLIDEKEIRQMFFNLVRNGLESMKTGGILGISTYSEGDIVVLSIEDQGEGMDPRVLEKLGTPFFTTKDSGTGLGLALSYSIADRHGATIDVESSSEGTKFKIKFISHYIESR